MTKRFSEIANRGKFYGKYAKKMSLKSPNNAIASAILRQPTVQESSLIKKLNQKGIQFKFHGLIETPRKFVVDFVLPSEQNPKIVLELKDFKTNYNKRSTAVELAYRAIKIHQKYPQIKMIAVLDGNIQQDALRIIREEYNKVLLNPAFQEIENAINL